MLASHHYGLRITHYASPPHPPGNSSPTEIVLKDVVTIPTPRPLRRQALVEVKDLTKFYGDVAAINGVTFEAKKGEILGLLGPNAAGKTTAMRIITGFMPPTSGTATVAGFDIVEESLEAREHL